MATKQPIFIGPEQIDSLCEIAEIMEIQEKVFIEFVNGRAVMGPRAILTQSENAQFSYIARASVDGPTIVKFGSVIPSNAQRDISVVQTTVAALNPVTGSIDFFFDGETVTKWRTVAASMAAAKHLANPIHTVGVIGLGHQGIAHIEAIHKIFAPERIIGFSRSAKTLDLGFPVETTTDMSALNECDLIFVCTNSIVPVVTSDLKLGTTCISIGSFGPNRVEVAPEVLAKADKVFGDDAETISKQAGSVVVTLPRDDRKWSKPESIGDLFDQRIKGRTNPEEVIYYFSVGLGIQDAAMVEYLLHSESFASSDRK